MRAIQVSRYVKGPKELKVTELPNPTPKPDEYLIEVHAAATNFFDILQIQGKYQLQPPFPWVSGVEFSGVILATPADSKNPRFPIGSRVFGASQGAYATKLEVARQFGADFAIDYRDPEWPDKVKKLTPKRRGVDIVYDPVGMVDKSTKCIAWNGRILVVGFAAGKIEKIAMNKVLLKNISLVGIHWGAYSIYERKMIPVVWRGIGKLIEQGKFKATVFTDREFVGLESVPDALLALGGRETWGKVVVKIPQPGESKL
ncbi:GroES-like protein [Hypoxylon sp. EC38]|nr:GroES-like protein [Hypoxylon sp. EC38]